MEKNEEEEYGRDDDQLEKFFVRTLDVHEEKSDEQRFDGGDGESDGGIEMAEIDACGENCQSGSGEQREPDSDVGG